MPELQQLGRSQRELKKELQKLLRRSNQTIDRIFYQSAQSGYGLDVSRFPYVQALPFERNASFQQISGIAAADCEIVGVDVRTVGETEAIVSGEFDSGEV